MFVENMLDSVNQCSQRKQIYYKSAERAWIPIKTDFLSIIVESLSAPLT